MKVRTCHCSVGDNCNVPWHWEDKPSHVPFMLKKEMYWTNDSAGLDESLRYVTYARREWVCNDLMLRTYIEGSREFEYHARILFKQVASVDEIDAIGDKEIARTMLKAIIDQCEQKLGELND